MKKLILLIILVLTVAVSPVAAQNKSKAERQQMWQEMQEFKLKFISQEIELKEDQQKKFTELYSQKSEEKRKVFHEIRTLEKKLKNNKDADDAEYASVMRSISAAKDKDAEIEKKYDEKFATVLTAKQIYKLREAEEKFRQKLQEMKHKKR
jgi:Spy/CpxP family protein refolding chaperone